MKNRSGSHPQSGHGSLPPRSAGEVGPAGGSMKDRPSAVCTQTRAEELLYLSFNFFATIAVTLINKYCFDKVDFGFPGALCNIHFAVTWLGCEMLRRLHFFIRLPNPPSPFKDINYATIIVVVGLVTPLNNTSLKHNSLGFYQLFKLLGTF
jgi:hypothetical protein